MWYLQEHNSCVKFTHPWFPYWSNHWLLYAFCSSAIWLSGWLRTLSSGVSRSKGAISACLPLLTILIQVINGSVLRHIPSCKSMSALPLIGLQDPKQGARSWDIGWNKWWALWVFPLFFCILCRCAPGYFGNPQKFGGSCQPCSCNSNGHLGSCDPLTGGKIDSHVC